MRREMEEKGFSLIELLTVLVILAIIILLITGAVLRMIKNSETKITKVQEDFIINAGEKWAVNNSHIFDDDDGTVVTYGLDVVFIIDVSGSMAYGITTKTTASNLENSRVYANTVAMNIALETLCGADYSCVGTNNRIGYVFYGGNTSASETSSIPAYSALTDKTKKIEIVTAVNGMTPRALNWSINTSQIYISYLPGANASSSITVTNGGSTYTQAGIQRGVNVITANHDKDMRIPVMILMSDGEANMAKSNPSASAPFTFATRDVTAAADVVLPTLKTATAAKAKMKDVYDGRGFFYTILLSEVELYGKFVLDPTVEMYNQLITQGTSTDNYKVANKVKSDVSPATYTGQYNYPDKAFRATSIEELKDAFRTISQEIKAKTEFNGLCVTVELLIADGYVDKEAKIPSGAANNDVVFIGYNEEFDQHIFEYVKDFRKMSAADQAQKCPKLIESE